MHHQYAERSVSMRSYKRIALISGITLVWLVCLTAGALLVFRSPHSTLPLSKTSLSAIGVAGPNLAPPARVRRDFHSTEPNRARLAENYGQIALSFEANAGQTDARVKYFSRGHGYSLFLTNDETVLSLRSRQPEAANQNNGERTSAPVVGERQAPSTQSAAPAVLRMKLKGANPRARVTALGELPGKTNYFIGNDPKKWRTNVPTYAKVKFRGVYPGVDLVYYGNQQQLEYDFVVYPGSNPSSIKFGLRDADKVSVDADGNLVVKVAGGAAQFQKPVIYQETRGVRQEIAGGYVLDDACQVSFQIGAYDHSKPLVIDPVLVYSTYLGGSGEDVGSGIAVDSAGNAYVTGRTTSNNFPTTAGAFQTTNGGTSNVFVTKLNSTGTGLVYSTYLGGNGSDVGNGIAVDSAGNAYVTGSTTSNNFPTTAGAFQTTSGGFAAAFVAKLNSTGSALVYSTYVGGSSIEDGYGIALDTSGNAYITGISYSANFPTTAGAFQTTSGGNGDAFVTKLNSTGSALVYSTYVGGSWADAGQAIAVDSSGNAYVTGYTQSYFDFPTTGGVFQKNYGGGSDDAFVTKLNSAGTALVYSTYLGGSSDEKGYGIALDSSGNAYVAGASSSINFPTTAGAFQIANGGSPYNATVTKLNSSGSALVYSTYLGGNGDDGAAAIALDSSGDVFVTGGTNSSNFPTTSGAFRTTLDGGLDAFVTELDPSGQVLLYSGYLGGSKDDLGKGIAIDSSGHAYVTGTAGSSNFPATGGVYQSQFGGGTENAFVAKITTTSSSDDDSGLADLSGGNSFTGSQTINGAVTATSFAGNGASLTAINPANISAGAAGINITGNAATATTATSSITALLANNALTLGGVAAANYARLDIGNAFIDSQSVTGDVTVSGALSAGSSLTIGGGTPITKYESATYVITVPSLKPNSCTKLTETLTAIGSGTNDTVALGVPNSFMSVGGFLMFQAWESALNTIEIRVCNVDPNGPPTSAVTDAIRVDVFKH